jgi:hypothetical protein
MSKIAFISGQVFFLLKEKKIDRFLIKNNTIFNKKIING